MKLFEIKGLEDGVRFKHFCLDDKYVYYDNGIFLNHKGNYVDIGAYLMLSSDSWELYKEPKKKKRFWIWSLKQRARAWIKEETYIDDDGRDTQVNQVYRYWNEFEKIKHENEYIDVEVDWEGNNE